MAKLIPPVSYFGGKGKMTKKLETMFPRRYTHYIEPFGGSFVMGLSRERPNVVEIYNDLEQNVYSLYKVISDKDLFEQLRMKLELSVYSEQMRLESLRALGTELSLVDRAYHFFYSSRTSRNGHGSFSDAALLRRGMCKAVACFLAAIDRLPELHLRLSKVMIRNTDGIGLLGQYDFPEAFYFLDPPYDHGTRSSLRYKKDMGREDQIRFLEAVRDSKAQCMICGYNNQLYNDMLGSMWKRTDFEIHSMSVGSREMRRTESVWLNYSNFESEME